MDSSGFGDRLRTARKAKNLPYRTLAIALECTEQAIWNYENRGGGINADKLFVLADLLQVSPRWLITGIDDGDVRPVVIQDTTDVLRKQALACLQSYVDGGRSDQNLVDAAMTILAL